MTTILIPCFAVSFEKVEVIKIIRAPPAPYQEDENNILSVFLSIRASPHIHDGISNERRQGRRLHNLMTFAWPRLLGKNSVDPLARYHGHLLLIHIIARLTSELFYRYSIYEIEVCAVVRQALEV